MAIIDYPSFLPLAQTSGKNMTMQTPFRADQPAVGAQIYQKMTTDIVPSWSITWIFTARQNDAFMQWFRSPRYLNKGINWFRMAIDLGSGTAGPQVQELHFTADGMPVQTSIDGGVVTWTAKVNARRLNNEMDDYDEYLVELEPEWFGILDEVVNRILPEA